jgi:hypothetical protein
MKNGLEAIKLDPVKREIREPPTSIDLRGCEPASIRYAAGGEAYMMLPV